MAFTTNLRTFFVNGVTWYHVGISETSVDNADTWNIEGVPNHGRIVMVRAEKTAGSATTLQPFFARTAAGAVDDTNKDFLCPAAELPLAQLPNQIVDRPYFDLAGGTLFGSSNVDAGADNDVTTEFLICSNPGFYSEAPALTVNYFTPQQLGTGSWTTFTIPQGTRHGYLFTADGSAFDARYNSDDNAVEKVPANTQWQPRTEGAPLAADFDVEFKATAGTPFLGGFYLTRG